LEWREKKILVTGAGGFIGSHLSERLVKLGANVKAFVRYNSRGNCGFIDLLSPLVREKIEVISGDLRDAEAVALAIRGVDVVFHLGAVISIPYSYIHPREVIETNIIGTFNVLSACKSTPVEKLVHTSTCEVYGTAQFVPMNENHPLQAQSPYAASKLAADKLAESFHKTYRLPITIIRPFNTYGPRQSARAIIPTIVTQALTSSQLFIGATHPTRDFTFVDDVIDAFIKIAEAKEAIGEVVNIGSNFEISIGDLVDKVLHLTNREEIKITFDATRVRPQMSEVERLWADNSKALNLIGWSPKTSFNDGLRKTIEWISEHINQYKVGVYNV
jgi:dTDP-glucose 4,6-dehydratase